MVNHKIMLGFLKAFDIHCIVAATLFVLGSFLAFIYRVTLARRIAEEEEESVGTFGDFNTTQLINVWYARFELHGLLSAAVFINACAWVVFSIVIIKLTWVLSCKGKYSMGSTVTIAVLAVGGAVAEFLASLLFLGANRAMLDIIGRYELNSWITLGGSAFTSAPEPRDSEPSMSQGSSGEKGTGSAPAPSGTGSPSTAPAAVPTIAPSVSPALSPALSPSPEDGNVSAGSATAGNPPGDRLLVDNFDLDEYNENDNKANTYYIDGDKSDNMYDGDGLGWKTLQLLHAVSNGLVSFIDAIEYLFISIILCMTFFAVLRKGRGVFSMTWAVFGLLVALMSLAQFITTVVALESWSPLYRFSSVLVLINQVLLLPIWVFWLGRQLKEAQTTMAEEADNKQTETLS